jgi:cytochrome d ubiquinol oxidase subunit I
VSFGEILFSLIALGLVYGVLMVFELRLLVTYVRGGVASAIPGVGETHDDDANGDGQSASDTDVLAFAY